MAVDPPRWTEKELAAEAGASVKLFRQERVSEPVETWNREVKSRIDEFRRLFELPSIIWPERLTADDVLKITKDGLLDAFRYLCGPPVSADDLKTLADVNSLSVTALRADHKAGATEIVRIFNATVDNQRFTWLKEPREPSQTELNTSITASAALLAGQRLQTMRRNASKQKQEDAVKAFLLSIGFQESRTLRSINTLEDAPLRGHFCGETKVGSRKADVLIRLFDGRLMLLECKVSYSELNSIKRVNNDAQVKAGIWLREFGERQVVPAAMLSGVFGVANLIRAQHGHLTLFWSHNLDAMREFIESTKSSSL